MGRALKAKQRVNGFPGKVGARAVGRVVEGIKVDQGSYAAKVSIAGTSALTTVTYRAVTAMSPGTAILFATTEALIQHSDANVPTHIMTAVVCQVWLSLILIVLLPSFY